MADDLYDSDEETDLPTMPPEATSSIVPNNPGNRGVVSRRLSAVVMIRPHRHVEELDCQVSDVLNDLIKKFPNAPTIVHNPITTTSNMSTTAMSAVRSGWGNLKTGLEKWSKGNKKSEEEKTGTKSKLF